MNTHNKIWEQTQWPSDEFLVDPSKVYFGKKPKEKKSNGQEKSTLLRKNSQSSQFTLLRRVSSQLSGVFTACLGDKLGAISEEERLRRELRQHIKKNMRAYKDDSYMNSVFGRTKSTPKEDWFAQEPHGYSLNNFFSSKKGQNDEELKINYYRDNYSYYDHTDTDSLYSYPDEDEAHENFD